MTNKNRILSVNKLHIEVEGKEIVKGVSLQINAGEKHAIMGKNGSGKSSLANALAGHPNYKITSGSVEMAGQDLLCYRAFIGRSVSWISISDDYSRRYRVKFFTSSHKSPQR